MRYCVRLMEHRKPWVFSKMISEGHSLSDQNGQYECHWMAVFIPYNNYSMHLAAFTIENRTFTTRITSDNELRDSNAL